MENEITAHRAGKVTELSVCRGRLGQRRRPDRDDRVTRRARRGRGDRARFRGAGPATSAPTCRCRRTSCRCAAAAAGASAGATSAPSPTSCCVCAARVHVGPLVPELLGGLRPRERRDLGEHPARCSRARAATCGPSTWAARRWSPSSATSASSTTRPTRARWCGSTPTCAARTTPGVPALRRRRSGSSRSARPTRGPVRVDAQARRRAGRVRRPGRRRGAGSSTRRGDGGRVRRLPPAPHGLELVGGRRRAPTDGRSVGWNLVAGINDPPERSERAIWIDGEPFEPGPVEFDGSTRSTSPTARGSTSRRSPSAQGGEPAARQVQLPPAVRHLRRAPCPAASSSRAASA